jgi:hypothetical protein
MTPAARLDALAERGVIVYLDGTGELHARCESCFAHVLDAARPMLAKHRAELIADLRQRANAQDRESSAGPQAVAPLRVSEGVCPECALP